jgi:putative ABC transport system permease protein
MELVARDLRLAWRRLVGQPGFTAIAMITLALGIGATTAIYAVVDALILRPLPYRESASLFQAMSVRASGGCCLPELSYQKFMEWRDQREIFEAVEPFQVRSATLAGGREPQSVLVSEVGGQLMTTLGVAARLGRIIQPDDAQPGRDGVVVLSDAMWRGAFGADAAVLGRPLRLDDRTFEVIGVMPPSFTFPRRSQVWVPLPLTAERSGKPATYQALARVVSGLTIESAQARANALGTAMNADKPLPEGWIIQLRALGGMNPGERYALLVLFGAVSLVLLVACTNLANLLLVQGAGRDREIAVRAALGASRGRIVRQLLAETLLLAAGGAALGLLVAWQAVSLLAAYTPTALTFLSANLIALDARVATFAIGVALATAASFGLLPAWRTSRPALHDALKSGSRGATDGPGHERLRRGFVVLQLALTLILLVGAGLLGRTFLSVTRLDPGFDAERLITTSMTLPRWKYISPESRSHFFEQVLARLRALPGVAGATAAGGAPPSGGGFSFGLRFEIDGQGVVLDDPRVLMPFANATPEYFDVLGIPLRAGRTFTAADATDATGPIVINETMARELWKGANPLGSRIRTGPKSPWRTVVGIVGDVYQFEHAKPRGQFATYYPMGAGRGGQVTLIVRTVGDPAAMVAAVQREIWAVDPDQPLWKTGTVRQQYAEFFDRPRFYALLMAAFAGIGLLIAAVGLYGALAYSVAQRTRELGIRMALGADRRDVIAMVMRTGALLIAAGLVLGAGGSLIVTRSLESMLVTVPRTDPWTYAIVVVTLTAAGFVAVWVPARRATRVDPVTALRAD